MATSRLKTTILGGVGLSASPGLSGNSIKQYGGGNTVRTVWRLIRALLQMASQSRPSVPVADGFSMRMNSAILSLAQLWVNDSKALQHYRFGGKVYKQTFQSVQNIVSSVSDLSPH